MPKNDSNSNINGSGPSGQPTIHLVLQGKGGVRKSVVASWLAEFLIKRGQLVRCIDGDPVNRSFAQYKAFSAEKLDLVNINAVLDRTCYDGFVERFLAEDAVFVLDNGATASSPSGVMSSSPI
jgi:Mrp family chromosome partitioning ATPase